MSTTPSAPVVRDDVRVEGTIVAALAPAAPGRGAAYLIEVQPQQTRRRDGSMIELPGRTCEARESRAFGEREIELTAGEMVVVLVDPTAGSKRGATIIGGISGRR